MPTAPLHELIQLAWAQHFRDPAELVPQGLHIAAQAGDGTVGSGWGWLHAGWGWRHRGQPHEARQARERAQAAFLRHADVAGLAACRDLQATELGGERRWQEALDLLAHNDAVPREQRSPWERQCTHQRRGWLYDQLGLRDDALRQRYLQLATARETGDDAPLASVLGSLGGMHADLYNLDEAERLCTQGVELAERCQALQAWSIAALNRLNALLSLGRGAEGLALADRLQQQEPRLNQRAREHRLIAYADVCTQAGELDRAQALLDESLRLRHRASESVLSHTTAQVAAWLAQGRLAQARDLGLAWLADPRLGTDPATVPAEQLRLLQFTSRACEDLGDAPTALRLQRQAFALHETLVGRSARARRLALEIEHELDRERWQREQAQARLHDAEADRRRLDAMNQALEAANLAKTRFLAAASHDLRQPVQALALFMAALQAEDLSEAQAALVERMSQSLASLSRMFDVLLDISRLDAGIVPVAVQAVALRPLLQRLWSEHGAVAAARGLHLRLRLPAGSSPCWADTDPVLLERCVRNLLDNALKYTARGGVLLALRRRAEGWQLVVADTGVGMTPEVQARAFDEFFQADNPERDRVRGLGLGLSIVRRLAGLLSHALALRSVPGRGSLVLLQLPASSRDEAEPPAAAAAPGASGGAAAGLCVAVLDDDDAVREGLVALLRRWGHDVLAGSDEEALMEAWHASGRPAPQALLCDLRLRHGRHGVQAVSALCEAWGRHVPALLITGDAAPDRLQLLRASGLPWLPKPVMPMRLRGWLAAQGGQAEAGHEAGPPGPRGRDVHG